jgi:hypothetical protein
MAVPDDSGLCLDVMKRIWALDNILIHPEESPKNFKSTADLGQTEAHHTNFKKSDWSKSARSGALLGLNFRGFY